MEEKKITVQFSAAPKTYDPRGNAGVVNQMWAAATDAEGDEIELYAEIDWPDPYSDPDSTDYDEAYGYDELKAEIISQAREHGIPSEVLKFFYDD